MLHHECPLRRGLRPDPPVFAPFSRAAGSSGSRTGLHHKRPLNHTPKRQVLPLQPKWPRGRYTLPPEILGGVESGLFALGPCPLAPWIVARRNAGGEHFPALRVPPLVMPPSLGNARISSRGI